MSTGCYPAMDSPVALSDRAREIWDDLCREAGFSDSGTVELDVPRDTDLLEGVAAGDVRALITLRRSFRLPVFQ